MESSIYKS